MGPATRRARGRRAGRAADQFGARHSVCRFQLWEVDPSGPVASRLRWSSPSASGTTRRFSARNPTTSSSAATSRRRSCCRIVRRLSLMEGRAQHSALLPTACPFSSCHHKAPINTPTWTPWSRPAPAAASVATRRPSPPSATRFARCPTNLASVEPQRASNPRSGRCRRPTTRSSGSKCSCLITSVTT